jgi:hypothetical protein
MLADVIIIYLVLLAILFAAIIFKLTVDVISIKFVYRYITVGSADLDLLR